MKVPRNIIGCFHTETLDGYNNRGRRKQTDQWRVSRVKDPGSYIHRDKNVTQQQKFYGTQTTGMLSLSLHLALA